MKQQIKTTADGSSTIYNATIDECYHSVHGARNESMHIFIRSGFDEIRKSEISIFEVGFGTGLNAWLTLQAAQKRGCRVHYTAVERYPLSKECYSVLNYADSDNEQPQFLQLHEADWGRSVAIAPNFTLDKIEADFTEFSLSGRYDLVYFDAFSPEKQPEMWSENIFRQLYEQMNEGGVLVTYCAKGVVRRTMQAVGFAVERIAGPVGKREILRARK